MTIDEKLKLRRYEFMLQQNKALKNKIIKENHYNLEVMKEIEIEIMDTLLKYQKKTSNIRKEV